MEIENSPAKLQYDYWKLLCIRSSLRVLALVIPVDEPIDVVIGRPTALRREHAALDGEDLLLIGRDGMAKGDKAYEPHVWRAGAFRPLTSPTQGST